MQDNDGRLTRSNRQLNCSISNSFILLKQRTNLGLIGPMWLRLFLCVSFTKFICPRNRTKVHNYVIGLLRPFLTLMLYEFNSHMDTFRPLVPTLTSLFFPFCPVLSICPRSVFCSCCTQTSQQVKSRDGSAFIA